MHIYTPIIPSLPLVPMAGVSNTAAHRPSEEESELRRGPWTVEEDTLLIHYIAAHGEGQWNLLAKQAGLKRTGKSCRLRWLNYLKPDIKRGNLTLQEQLLILELHSKWGNRWSKIAQELPGRTDNEIKNYWRTRVQKQLRQLKVQAHSRKLLDAICHLSMLEAMDQTSNYSINLPPSLHNMNLPNSSNSTVVLPANHGSRAPPPPPPPRSVQQWPEVSAWPPSPCGEFMEAWRFDMVGQKQQHEAVGALGDWEVGDRDAQMIAPDWVLEDAMVENLWSLDHHLI